MSEDVAQLQQLRRVRVSERHRCERELKAAVEHHGEVAEMLDSLEQAVASSAARCDDALRTRMNRPADPAVADYCRTMETALADLRCKLETARLRLDEAVQALVAARKRRIRAEQWIEAIENRLREARMRERKRRQSRRDDNEAPIRSHNLCGMPL